MLERAALATTMMMASIGCAARVTAGSPPPPTLEAEPEAAPCSIEGSIDLRRRAFPSRLYRTVDALSFTRTAAGLMLVHADILGYWTQVEFGAGTKPLAQRRGASRLVKGLRLGLDLDLGARWVYATTVPVSDSDGDTAIGDLHDPGALRRIDARPEDDTRPQIVSGHDGGWAVVSRDASSPSEHLRFALLGADGQSRDVRDLGLERPVLIPRLLRTPGGFALLYIEASPYSPTDRPPPRLVLRLLDREGELYRHQVLFEGPVGDMNATLVPGGIAVIFEDSDAHQALLLRTDLAGAIVTPARPIFTDAHSLASIHLDDIQLHRGLLWSAIQVHYVGHHRQMARPRALLVPVTLDGRAAAPIELTRTSSLEDIIALGSTRDALVVAWLTGPFFSRTPLSLLHVAEVRCAATRP